MVHILIGEEAVQRRNFLHGLRATSESWEELSAAEVGPSATVGASLFATAETPLTRVITGYAQWTPAQRKQFAELIKDLPEGLQLVLLVKQLGAKDILRTVVDEKNIHQFQAPKGEQLPQWINVYCKQIGRSIDPGAVDLLLARLGENTASLSSEIDKLALAHAEVINAALVESLTPDEGEVLGWNWVDYMIDLKGKQAFTELAKLEGGDFSPLALTGALSSRLLQIAWVHLMLNPDDVGVKPFPWRKAKEAVRGGWNPARTRAAIIRVGKCEAALKGQSTLPEWVVFSQFCHEWFLAS